MRIMKYLNLKSTLMIGLIGFMLAACQTSGQRDSGGTLMKLDEDKGATIADSRLTTPFFINPERLENYKKTIRDGGSMVNEIYNFKNGSYFIDTQFVTSAWFSRTTVRNIDDREVFENNVSNMSNKSGVALEIGENSIKFGGYVQYYNDYNCFFMRAGKRIKARTIFDNDYQAYDTIIRANLCQDDIIIKPEALIANLEQLKKTQRSEIIVRFSDYISNLSRKAVMDTNNEDNLQLVVNWEGRDGFSSGWINFSHKNPDGTYPLMINLFYTGENDICKGNYTLQKGPKGDGFWQIYCDSGATAFGDWSWADQEQKGANGVGEDEKGNKVTFTVRP